MSFSVAVSSPNKPNFSATVTTDQSLSSRSYSYSVYSVATGTIVATGSGTWPVQSSPFTLANIGSAISQAGQYYLVVNTTNSGGTPLSATSNTFQLYPVVTPTASLISPAANAKLQTLTPTFTIGYTDTASGSPYGFSAYDFKVRRKSDQVSFRASNPASTSSTEQTNKQATPAYDGTALSWNTDYEIAVRVQDAWQSTWSNWSAWITFTPAQIPALPTGILPSGLQTTLTPTVGLTYHTGPGLMNMAAWNYQVMQGTITVYDSGDITASLADGASTTQVYGTNNASDTPSTPPALGWGTQYYVRARSKNTSGNYSDWTDWVAFNTESTPLAPSNLNPSGGAVTAATLPTLTWQHNSPEGVAQSAVKIWLETAAGVFVTGYDPKTLSQSTESHTVTVALTSSPATNYKWWVETEADSGPGYSPDSAVATFTVSPGPSVTVSSPSSGGTVTTGILTVAHAFTAAAGTTLSSWRQKLYDSDGTTVLEDSGSLALSGTSDTSSRAFTTHLENHKSYYVEVTVTDSNSSTVSSGLIPFTTSFTPPASITGVAVTMLGGDTPSDRSQKVTLPGVLVNWDTVAAPSSPESFLSYNIYRQLAGDSTWTLVAAVADINTGAYVDYTAACAATYTYTVTQLIDDGSGGELESDRGTGVQLTVTFGTAAFLHDYANAAYYSDLPAQGRKRVRAGQNTYLPVWDADVPIVHINNTKARTMNVSFNLPWLSGWMDKAAALDALQDRQIGLGSVFVYRDQRGEVMVCVFDTNGIQQQDAANVAAISFDLVEVKEPSV